MAPALVAQGGPPLITDDPDTPGPGHWEINLAASRETNQSGTTVESLADINVGVGRRLQLLLADRSAAEIRPFRIDIPPLCVKITSPHVWGNSKMRASGT